MTSCMTSQRTNLAAPWSRRATRTKHSERELRHNARMRAACRHRAEQFSGQIPLRPCCDAEMGVGSLTVSVGAEDEGSQFSHIFFPVDFQPSCHVLVCW